MNPLIPALIGSLFNAPQPAPEALPPAGIFFRTIPAAALRGEMQPPSAGSVSIAGNDLRLAPGLQIRDPQNRIILSDTVRQPLLVKYLTDSNGQVARIWVLTGGEASLP